MEICNSLKNRKMKKFTLLQANGTTDFQNKLSTWLKENEKDQIISVDHSSTEITLPVGNGTMAKGYAFSAVILHESRDSREEPSFGWDEEKNNEIVKKLEAEHPDMKDI